MTTTYEYPLHGWTCFHCGETFTTRGAAQTHFGATPDAQPGCLLRVGVGPERGLLAALRKAEDEAQRAQTAVLNASTEAHQTMYEMYSRHADALRDAEELGYARGLHEGGDELRELLLWREKAFIAHPNIDRDIEMLDNKD